MNTWLDQLRALPRLLDCDVQLAAKRSPQHSIKKIQTRIVQLN